MATLLTVASYILIVTAALMVLAVIMWLLYLAALIIQGVAMMAKMVLSLMLFPFGIDLLKE